MKNIIQRLLLCFKVMVSNRITVIEVDKNNEVTVWSTINEESDKANLFRCLADSLEKEV